MGPWIRDLLALIAAVDFPMPGPCAEPPVKASLNDAHGFPMRDASVETPRTAPASFRRRARGGWASMHDLAAVPRSPDAASIGFHPEGRARRCDASVSLGEACHGRGRRRPISAATAIVGTNRRKRDPRNDPSPRVRATEPPRNGCDAECRGAWPDIGLPSRARRFRAAHTRDCEPLRFGRRAVLRRHEPRRAGRGPRVEESHPGKDGIEPRSRPDARSVSSAGVRTRIWSLVADPPTRPRLACRRTSREGRRHDFEKPPKGPLDNEPERVLPPSSCTGRAGSLPTRDRDDPRAVAAEDRSTAPSHCGPAAPTARSRRGAARQGASSTFAVRHLRGGDDGLGRFSTSDRAARARTSDGGVSPVSVTWSAAPTTTSTTDCFRG